MHLPVFITYQIQENNLMPYNAMETMIDIVKHTKKEAHCVTFLIHPVTLLQNKTQFFPIAFIGKMC